MFAIQWRATLFPGLFLVLFAVPSMAQDSEPLRLDEALYLAGVSGEPVETDLNPRIVGPLADTEAAQALVGQARLSPNPEISFEVENIAGSGAFSGLNSTEYTLAVGQRIELGNKRGARVRAAQTQANLVSLQGNLALADLAFAVRERFVLATAAVSRVELARDVVERNRELARIADVLVEVGREPPLRALRANATLAEAEAELQAAQAASLAARTALASLWNATGSAPEVPSDFPAIEPPQSFSLSPASLQIQLSRAESEAARAGFDEQRSLRIPDPVVSAGVRRFEETNDTAFLVGVSIPLPFRNRNEGNIAAAQARIRSADAREAVALANYRQSVARAQAEYFAAEARVNTLSYASLPQAEEALRLVRIGYRNGKFPLIEVLAAAEARDAIREAVIAAEEDLGLSAALLIRLAAQ